MRKNILGFVCFVVVMGLVTAVIWASVVDGRRGGDLERNWGLNAPGQKTFATGNEFLMYTVFQMTDEWLSGEWSRIMNNTIELGEFSQGETMGNLLAQHGVWLPSQMLAELSDNHKFILLFNQMLRHDAIPLYQKIPADHLPMWAGVEYFYWTVRDTQTSGRRVRMFAAFLPNVQRMFIIEYVLDR